MKEYVIRKVPTYKQCHSNYSNYFSFQPKQIAIDELVIYAFNPTLSYTANQKYPRKKMLSLLKCIFCTEFNVCFFYHVAFVMQVTMSCLSQENLLGFRPLTLYLRKFSQVQTSVSDSQKGIGITLHRRYVKMHEDFFFFYFILFLNYHWGNSTDIQRPSVAK